MPLTFWNQTQKSQWHYEIKHRGVITTNGSRQSKENHCQVLSLLGERDALMSFRTSKIDSKWADLKFWCWPGSLFKQFYHRFGTQKNVLQWYDIRQALGSSSLTTRGSKLVTVLRYDTTVHLWSTTGFLHENLKWSWVCRHLFDSCHEWHTMSTGGAATNAPSAPVYGLV